MVLDVKGLSKYYGKVRALEDFSISVKEGELFGLLGPNGAGKSTIIKCLTGQIRPTSGTITLQGIDAIKHPVKIREIVGIIPEQENPPSFLTAIEYLEFIKHVRNIDADALSWLKLLDCEDQKDILCKDLSRGTRQKLMFIQAFIHNPKIAFIDEPLVNLDPISQKKIKDFLKNYVKSGNTVFFSTHDLGIAKEICTRIAIIYKGRLIYEGLPKKNLESFFIQKVTNETS